MSLQGVAVITGGSGGGGVTAFIQLSDVPNSYAGAALQVVRVNAGETGLEFATVSGTGDVVGPASATDNALVRFDGTSGKAIQNSGIIIDDSNNITGVTSITASNTGGLRVLDTDASHSLLITTGTNQTADRTFTINTLNGNRTLQLNGNLSTSGAFPIILTLTGSTDVTFPTTGTLATLDGSETLTNKTLTTPTIASFTNATHNHTNSAGGGQLTDAALSSAVTVAKGGTGATTLTGLVVGNGTSAFTTVTAPSGTVVGTSDTQTLTNKRITQRIGSTASSATPTINTDNVDRYYLTALATNVTSFTTNLSGTPTDPQNLWIVITDDGTPRTLTWGSSFEASTIPLPTTTVASTRLDVGFTWNAVTSKWRCVAVA